VIPAGLNKRRCRRLGGPLMGTLNRESGAWPFRVDAIADQGIAPPDGPVFRGIDAVVDDVDALGFDVEQAQQILTRSARHRDDRVACSIAMRSIQALR